ncbi:MAG TPA: hypothetical protein VGN26_06785 [Armatimonadota bacterium]|jgi:hypothetical protein
MGLLRRVSRREVVKTGLASAGLMVASAAGLLGSESEPGRGEPIRLEVDPDRTVVEPFLGLGVQWDPFDRYQPSAEDWAIICERMAYCRPGFLRVMGSASAYCLGFGSDGEPRYVWKEGTPEQKARLERLCDILRWAQSHRVDVILGEWGPPRGLVGEQTDPRWPRIIAGCLEYLRKERGFKVVRYYNLINEPNGDWSGNRDYPTWRDCIRGLHQELARAGLSKQVAIIGPDTTGSTGWMEPFEWLDRCVRDLPEEVGVWDLHWYALDPEVLKGDIERVLAEKRRMLEAAGPSALRKPRILGESGMLTGRVNGDQQPRVRSFEYGVMMADYVAQVARAGWQGATAWDLDDAMHLVNGRHAPDPPDDLTLKVWGFWNSQGARMGRPEEMALRPWYYTWSLFSRLFPSRSRIVAVTGPDAPRVRAVAGARRLGGRDELTLMLVNNSNARQGAAIRVRGGFRKADLTTYHYFETDRPADAKGYPKAKQVLRAADLSHGLDLELPTRGVLFLTTAAEEKGRTG